MNATRLVLRAIDFFGRCANYFADICLVGMALLISVEVFSRALFRVSTLVGEEWPAYLLVCIVFFGMAQAFREDAFLSVGIFSRRLQRRSRTVLRCVCVGFALAFIALFDYQLVRFVAESYASDVKSISYSETPLYIPQLAMPIGLSLLGLQLIREGIDSVLALRKSNETGAKPE